MKTALALLQLIPAIIALIPSLNAFIPEGGQGATKLALMKTILTEAYDGISSLWPMIDKIVTALCAAKKTVAVKVVTTPSTDTTVPSDTVVIIAAE